MSAVNALISQARPRTSWPCHLDFHYWVTTRGFLRFLLTLMSLSSWSRSDSVATISTAVLEVVIAAAISVKEQHSFEFLKLLPLDCSTYIKSRIINNFDCSVMFRYRRFKLMVSRMISALRNIGSRAIWSFSFALFLVHCVRYSLFKARILTVRCLCLLSDKYTTTMKSTDHRFRLCLTSLFLVLTTLTSCSSENILMVGNLTYSMNALFNFVHFYVGDDGGHKVA